MTAEPRFLTSDPTGREAPWDAVDAILDALEQSRLDADDYLFDRVRQAWQPIRTHGEIVAAWDTRMGFRPPPARRLITDCRRSPEGFPALSPEGITPVSSPAVSRIEAARRSRALTPVEALPAVRRGLAAGVIAAALVVLGLLAAGLLLAVRLVMGSGSGWSGPVH